jgi:hypothetical protein
MRTASGARDQDHCPGTKGGSGRTCDQCLRAENGVVMEFGEVKAASKMKFSPFLLIKSGYQSTYT